MITVFQSKRQDISIPMLSSQKENGIKEVSTYSIRILIIYRKWKWQMNEDTRRGKAAETAHFDLALKIEKFMINLKQYQSPLHQDEGFQNPVNSSLDCMFAQPRRN